MAAPLADLLLPDRLRPRLARPLAPLVQTEGLLEAVAGRPVAAVGDVVALTCLELGIEPRLVVCDLSTRRGGYDAAFGRVLGAWGDRQARVQNPAGRVTAAAWRAIEAAFAAPGTTCVIVEGEEDLLGLPVLIEAPPGTVMLYGMPGEGVVVCEVDALRQAAKAIVAGMTPVAA